MTLSTRVRFIWRITMDKISRPFSVQLHKLCNDFGFQNPLHDFDIWLGLKLCLKMG